MNEADLGAFARLFDLLERLEVVRGVDFSKFDMDDEADIKTIATEYLGPAISSGDEVGLAELLLAIERFEAGDTARLQLLKDRCQELSMPDPGSWDLFLRGIGKYLTEIV